MSVLVGQSSNEMQDRLNAAANGGITTIASQQLLTVNVQEIVKCTCLAMYRRRELLGPLAVHDPLTDEVLAQANRRQGKPGNWSEAWLDVEQGIANSVAGKIPQATTALQRALTTVQGEFDHSLTGIAFLELGRIALAAGDFKSAAKFYLEASYTAYDFGDLTVLDEAFRGMFSAAIAGGDLPDLDNILSKATAWAKARELRASLLLMSAESLALRGQTAPAANLLTEATGVIGRRAMGACEFGSRLNALLALTHYQRGAMASGDSSLNDALTWFRNGGSKWLFQIGLADDAAVSGRYSSRVALALYADLLRDPAAADWTLRPLEALTVMATPHLLAYDHWLELVIKQASSIDAAAGDALEVADLARRHRFLSSLLWGGRLMALRWTLESPDDALDNPSRVQRQDLLTRYPKYAELAQKAAKLRAEIAQAGLNGQGHEAQHAMLARFNELGTISESQELMLREMAVRREAANIAFPPVRKTKELQKALAPDCLLLAYYNVNRSANAQTPGETSSTYAWFVASDRASMWKVENPSTLAKKIPPLLKALGNYDANHDLQDVQLTDTSWKQPAADLVQGLVRNPKKSFDATYKEIAIVPDGMLWYVPFETLPLGDPNDATPLISRMRVRYAPLTSLAVPQRQGRKQSSEIGVALGKFFPGDTPEASDATLEQIRRAAPQAVALRNPLPAASPLLGAVLDELIVLDDAPNEKDPFDAPMLPSEKGKNPGTLSAWLALPWKVTDQYILPAFHTPAENALKAPGPAPGNDLFITSTALLSTGARTVLLSRWRTGGQSAIDLVREFVQELPFIPAAEAWQRAVQLVSQSPLDPLHEPRVKHKNDAPTVNAEHPFFWSGYMLVDTGAMPEKSEPATPRPKLKLEAKNAAGANPADIKAAVPPIPPPAPKPDAMQPEASKSEIKMSEETKPGTNS
jgi:hypothetical protein